MLPFAVYKIPETPNLITATHQNWLMLVVPGPLTEDETDLLRKIASALKADFSSDVICFQHDPLQEISLAGMLPPGIKMIISFGVLPSHLGIWIDMQGQGICSLEAYTFILTLPPDQLARSANGKKELWAAMQSSMDQ